MNWLARLKKTQMPPNMDATNATKPGFVGFVASIPAHIQKTEGVSLAANDTAQAVTLAADPVPVFTEPAAPSLYSDAWRVLAQAYYAHHFTCHVCQAAGRGTGYGLRCGTGAALWTPYDKASERTPS